MRALLALGFVLALTGCISNRPYTSEDLKQVHEAYSTILPILKSFEAAYFHDNTPKVLLYYRKERQACRLVDVIDRRDSIDPNVKLFAASADLDDFCNDIEDAFATWAIAHHYPYDKNVKPILTYDAFKQSELDLKKMPELLRHPADLA